MSTFWRERLGDVFRLSPRGLKGRLLRKPLHTSPFGVLVLLNRIEKSYDFRLENYVFFSMSQRVFKYRMSQKIEAYQWKNRQTDRLMPPNEGHVIRLFFLKDLCGNCFFVFFLYFLNLLLFYPLYCNKKNVVGRPT